VVALALLRRCEQSIHYHHNGTLAFPSPIADRRCENLSQNFDFGRAVAGQIHRATGTHQGAVA
jgi:hypothetical protein